MTQSTAVSVVPANMQLPAHLQTPEAVAAIALANAAAAGGIRGGGFPRISIKGSKFHEIESGVTNTYMMAPAAAGQPPLPMMCMEVVIVAANPALVKTFYEGEYQPGDDREPTCSSDNGVTPDAHIVNKQNDVCATCKQNQWGSKISKASGKDVKACTDNKRLAVLHAWYPAGLDGKMLGLSITPAALGEWGKYVKALTEHSPPINICGIVTNLTFDHTAAFPKLQFAFNRFLLPAEYAKVVERQKGDDVKNIVSITRSAAVALPSPAATALLPSAATPGVATTSAAQPEPAKPVDPFEGRPAHVKAAVEGAGGVNSVAGGAVYKALTGKDIGADVTPAPVELPKPVDPFEGQPAHVEVAVEASGGLTSAAGIAVYKVLTGKDYVPAGVVATEPAKRTRRTRAEMDAAKAAETNATALATTVPEQGAPAVSAPATGPVFATPAAAANEQPSAAIIASASNLKEKLLAKLAQGKAAG